MPDTVANVTPLKPPLPAAPSPNHLVRGARGGCSAERSGPPPVRAVLLPGSGSDALFVRSVFGPALRAAGVALEAVDPRPGADVVAGYRAALDAALSRGTPLLVGGISLGAHVATAWAADQDPAVHVRLVGVLVALPAWTGAAAGAPAAAAARLTAAQVRIGGLPAAVAAARAGAPAWLADELARAWAGYGPGLADALDAAADCPAPDPAALRALPVPVGIAALADDPVHPLATARSWARLLPRAATRTTTLAAFGADPPVVGRAAVRAWRAASAGGPAGGAPAPARS
jgi:pimeloyl-ACP methyl ester carboxylesterase